MNQIDLIPELSVIIPVFNEEEVIAKTLSVIRSVLEGMGIYYEILVVNDGSHDQSLNIIKVEKSKFPGIRVISFFSNQGHMQALLLGMRESKGKFILTIDADLQDPPELIPQMYHKLISEVDKNGNPWEVVQASRVSRSSDSFFKRSTANIYYHIAKIMTGVTLIPHAADFRIIRREVRDVIVDLPERNKVLRLLIPYLGFNIAEVEFSRSEREAGKSKYTFSKMMSLAIDSLISFSEKPLRWLSKVGILFAFVSMVLTLVTWLLWLYTKTVTGWASIFFLILSFNSFFLISLGLTGEYIGRIFSLSQQRPFPRHFEI